jgi:RNA polymerase sigma-70 factor (TIGR02960 family)
MAAEAAVVAAAQEGDEAAFRRLTEPYARELHVHCYRMLGSIHDAEDALQETLLRAWRHIGGFEPRAPFRAWLYKIATNVCLSAAGRSASESVPYPMNADGEALVRTPYPDAWLDELRSEPEVRYDLHESVQLAFLAAIQVLPPRQRAVLLLRDVLGFAADETAELIGSSTPSVNSALQRARAGLDRWRAAGRLDIGRSPAPDDVQQSLVRRYVEAWEAVDVDGLLALLREDAVMTMPPSPLIFEGRESIVEFFATVPADGALDQIQLLPTRANGQPALGAYLDGRAYGLMVLTIDGHEIAEITGFSDPALMPEFGLPAELSSPGGAAP